MGEIMGGEATPAQIGGFLVALRLKGETADEIAGCAEAMREHVLPVRPQRDDLVDTAGTGGDGAQHVQHLDRRRARRRGGGRRRREARQPRRLLGVGLGRRARGARLPARAAAGADRAVDRRARLRLHVRADPPPGDAARGAGAARARGAHGLQRARPADEPGRRPRAGRRRLRAARSCGRSRRCSRSSARAAPSSCTARAGSTSSRPPGRTSSARSSTARCASARSTRSSSASSRCDPDELRGGSPEENAQAIRAVFAGERTAAGATRSCSTPPARSPPPGTPRTCARASSSRARRSTRAPRRRRAARRARSRFPLMRSLRDALAGAGPRRDRRVQAALALARATSARTPTPHGSPRATSGRRGRDLGARRRALRRHLGRSARGARGTGVPLLAKGFFSTEEHLRDGEGGRRRRRAAAPPRPRRRAGARADAPRAASSASTRSSRRTTPTSSSAPSRSARP